MTLKYGKEYCPRIALEFPPTSWDLLAEVSRRDAASADALNEFADRYHAAIRAFIAALVRAAGDPDDLAQRFFETIVLSGRLFERADPHKGRFRPYLKQAIRNFLVDERRRQARSVQSDIRPDGTDDGWDTIAAETSPAPDEELVRAWARSLVAMAVKRCEVACGEHGQAEHFELFARRYLHDPDQPPSWREIGAAFGLDEKIARSRAETAARRFRTLLRALIASDVGSVADVDNELHAVIAVL